MPMVLSVLTISVFNLTHVAFKVAVEKEFSDLKGLIDTDVLDKAAMEMLETMPENEWSTLMSECIHSVQNTITALAFYDERDWHKEFILTKPIDLSVEFLSRLGFYKTDDEFDTHWEQMEWLTRFCSYVFYMLCQVMKYGKIDFGQLDGGYDFEYPEAYMNNLAALAEGESEEILVLSILAIEMLNYYIRLVELESRSDRR